MSKIEEQAREAIRKLSAAPEVIFTGKVIELDQEKVTIDVDLLDGRKRFGISLRSIQTDSPDGVTLWPAMDSMVVLARIGNTSNYTLLNADKLDKITWKIGDMSLEVTEQGFVFNNGTLGETVDISKLVTQLKRLEDTVSTHQHAYASPTGAAVTTSDPSASQMITPSTSKEDIANEKIKQ